MTYLHGALENKAVEGLVAKVLGNVQTKAALADVLAQTGVKFVQSKEGQKTVGQLSWAVALPSFALGAFVAWLLLRRKG